MAGLSNLIKALTILQKYEDPVFPTHCEHDVLLIMVPSSRVTTEDIIAISKLGFNPSLPDDEYGDCFYSYLYGSA